MFTYALFAPKVSAELPLDVVYQPLIRFVAGAATVTKREREIEGEENTMSYDLHNETCLIECLISAG